MSVAVHPPAASRHRALPSLRSAQPGPIALGRATEVDLRDKLKNLMSKSAPLSGKLDGGPRNSSRGRAPSSRGSSGGADWHRRSTPASGRISRRPGTSGSSAVRPKAGDLRPTTAAAPAGKSGGVLDSGRRPSTAAVPAKRPGTSEAKKSALVRPHNAFEFTAASKQQYLFGGQLVNSATRRQVVTTCNTAAQDGDASAQFDMGLMHELGLGLKQDFNKAASWYKQGAEQGHSKAQNNLAAMYERGWGVEQSMEQVQRWLVLASEQGDALAAANLERLRSKGAPSEAAKLATKNAATGGAAEGGKANANSKELEGAQGSEPGSAPTSAPSSASSSTRGSTESMPGVDSDGEMQQEPMEVVTQSAEGGLQQKIEKWDASQSSQELLTVRIMRAFQKNVQDRGGEGFGLAPISALEAVLKEFGVSKISPALRAVLASRYAADTTAHRLDHSGTVIDYRRFVLALFPPVATIVAPNEQCKKSEPCCEARCPLRHLGTSRSTKKGKKDGDTVPCAGWTQLVIAVRRGAGDSKQRLSEAVRCSISQCGSPPGLGILSISALHFTHRLLRVEISERAIRHFFAPHMQTVPGHGDNLDGRAVIEMLWKVMAQQIENGEVVPPLEDAATAAAAAASNATGSGKKKGSAGKKGQAGDLATPPRLKRRPLPLKGASPSKFEQTEAELKKMAVSSPLTPGARLYGRAVRAETALRSRRAMEMAWARQVRAFAAIPQPLRCLRAHPGSRRLMSSQVQFRFNMLWAIRKRRVVAQVVHKRAGKLIAKPKAESLGGMQVGEFR